MWKSININKQNIKRETSNALLINMPHNSDYDGYSFWCSLKLVKQGKNASAISVSYTDTFAFKLVQYGQGKWNKNEIIHEKTITAVEFEKAFDVMNKNIIASSTNNESYVKVEEPIKIDKDIEIIECLKNNN